MAAMGRWWCVLTALGFVVGCSRNRHVPNANGEPQTRSSGLGPGPGGVGAGVGTGGVGAAAAGGSDTRSPELGVGGGAGRLSQCGSSPCRVFDDARAAFATVLEPLPAVLAVGESHAQQGTLDVEPSTRRFTRELLPLLAGRASDVVVELMLPNPKCAPEVKAARQEQKVVTDHQARTDQSDYVELGTRAKALGIRPHGLEPTCDDLSRIAKAGPDVVTVSLDVVTRLATETLSKLVAANAAASDRRMVVAYGGMMHNDLKPRPELAEWSFGPALARQTGNRYTELDLVVPQQIQDSPTWRALPWVPGFAREAHPTTAVVLSPGPRSFVLVFAENAAKPPEPTGTANPAGAATRAAPSASAR